MYIPRLYQIKKGKKKDINHTTANLLLSSPRPGKLHPVSCVLKTENKITRSRFSKQGKRK